MNSKLRNRIYRAMLSDLMQSYIDDGHSERQARILAVLSIRKYFELMSEHNKRSRYHTYNLG